MGYYGKLNTPISKANYGGSTTDSLIINVDNDKMIISGEVIWGDMLGTAACKAYPGNLGNQNYENILKLTTALNQEITRALNSESTLNIKVEKGIQNAEANAQEALTIATEERTRALAAEDILRKTLLNEVSKLIDSEADLLSKINAETEARDSADQLIKDQLDYILNNISSGVNGIDLLLKAEQDRAQEAEKLLNEKIEEEKRRALNSESILEDQINDVINSNNNKIAELTTEFNDKFTSNNTQINEIKIKLNKEIERSENKDNEYKELISNNTNEINSINQVLNNTSSMVSDHDEKLNSTISQVNTHETLIKELNDTDILTSELLNKLTTNLSIEIQRSENRDMEHSKLISDQSTEINSINQQLINTTSIISDHDEKLNTLVSQIEDHETSIKSLNEIDILHNELITNIDNKLSNEIERSTLEEQTLLSNYNELKNIVSQNSTRLNNDESRIDEIEFLNEKHNEDIVELNSTIATLNEKDTSLDSRIEDLYSVVKLIDSSIIEHEEEFNKKMNDLDSFSYGTSQSIANLTGRVEELEPLSERHTSDIETLKSTVEEGFNSLHEECDLFNSTLSSEITRSTSKDIELEEKLNTEIDDLKVKIYNDKQLIQNSIGILEEEDLKIYQSIENSKLDTLEKDLAIIELINNEQARAQQREDELQSDINTTQELFNGPYVNSKPPCDGTVRAYVAYDKLDSQIEVTTDNIPDSIVQRNDNGQITLTPVIDLDNFDLYKDNEAIPRAYVDINNDSIRAYIDSEIAKIYRIDFVDGGNAPIPH